MTKPTKSRAAREDTNQPACPRNLFRVFAVSMEKAWLPVEYQMKSLIRLCSCTSKALGDAHMIL